MGPFAQFQNCGDDGDSITKLVEQLVRRLPNAEPDHDTVKTQVDIFKAQVEELLAEQATDLDEDAIEQDEASTAKLFEEIKVMFQDLPSRIDVAAERVREPRRMRKIHPGMIHEMIHMLSRGEPSSGTAALIVASFFRDELPWLYEMGVEVYRQSLTAKPTAVRRAYGNFIEAAHMASRGPFARELRSEHMRMLLDAMPMLLRISRRNIDQRPSPADTWRHEPSGLPRNPGTSSTTRPSDTRRRNALSGVPWREAISGTRQPRSEHRSTTGREGRRSNPNLVWKRIGGLHAKRFREAD